MKHFFRKFILKNGLLLILSWLNFGFALILALKAASNDIPEQSAAIYQSSITFLACGIVTYLFRKVLNKYQEAKAVASIATVIGSILFDQLKRYKELYGELPPEETPDKK